MTRSNWLAAAGGASFLVFLVGGIPATAAIGLLAPAGVHATGTAGTLWSGSAASVRIGGVRLGEIRWTVVLTRLLMGSAAASIEAQMGNAAATGTVSFGLSGTMSCVDCLYEGPLASLAGAIPALKAVDGRARIDVALLEVNDHWPTRLIGSASLSEVPLGLQGAAARSGIPRGSFQVSVQADPVPPDGTIEASVQDAGGPLEVVARAKVTKPGSYDISGRVKARRDATQELVDALNVLGPRMSDGSTEITLAGTF